MKKTGWNVPKWSKDRTHKANYGWNAVSGIYINISPKNHNGISIRYSVNLCQNSKAGLTLQKIQEVLANANFDHIGKLNSEKIEKYLNK